MTSTSFQAPEISTEIRIFADWEQSSSAIWWQGLDEDPEDKTTWHHTPYQVADAGHNQEEALRLVADLAKELRLRSIEPVFAFSVRETEEKVQPDGSVKKVAIFRHAGFVQAL